MNESKMNRFKIHITKEEKAFHKRVTAVCHVRSIVEQSPCQEGDEKFFLIAAGGKVPGTCQSWSCHRCSLSHFLLWKKKKKCPLTLGPGPHVVNESQWPKVLAPATGSGLHSGSTFSMTQMWLPPKVKDMDLDNTEALLKITLTCPINTTSRHTARLNPCLVAFHSTCSSTDQTASY